MALTSETNPLAQLSCFIISATFHRESRRYTPVRWYSQAKEIATLFTYLVVLGAALALALVAGTTQLKVLCGFACKGSPRHPFAKVFADWRIRSGIFNLDC